MTNLTKKDGLAYVADLKSLGHEYVSRNDIFKNTGKHVEYACNQMIEMGILIKEVVPNTGAVRYKIA